MTFAYSSLTVNSVRIEYLPRRKDPFSHFPSKCNSGCGYTPFAVIKKSCIAQQCTYASILHIVTLRNTLSPMHSPVQHLVPSVLLNFTFHARNQQFTRLYYRSRVTTIITSSTISTSSSVMDFSYQAGAVTLSLTGGLFLLGAIATGFSLAFQPTWLVRWLQKVHSDVFFLKPTEAKVIALTIDDAPHPDITPQILKVLQENDCKATFFVIGENMDSWPGLVERMHAEGHEVGNHTMQDVASWRLSPNDFLHQLMEVDDRIAKYFTKDVTGKPIKWFRPGHGFYTSWMLAIAKAHGYRVALGSLYPHDTLFTAQARLISNYLLWRCIEESPLRSFIHSCFSVDKIHEGAIIVLHDRGPQRDQTSKVLRTILPELKIRGYEIVTLSQLHQMPQSKDYDPNP